MKVDGSGWKWMKVDESGDVAITGQQMALEATQTTS